MRFELDPPLDEGLRSALIDLWTDVTNAGGAVGLVPPVTANDVVEVADSSFDRVTRGEDRLIVAFEDDRPVGLAFLAHRPGPLFRHWATVKRLMVHPELQGRGFGARLLEAVHEKGLEIGLEQIHLTVRGGTGTESFYERHGYEVKARIPDVIRVAPDDDREEIYMVKRLKG